MSMAVRSCFFIFMLSLCRFEKEERKRDDYGVLCHLADAYSRFYCAVIEEKYKEKALDFVEKVFTEYQDAAEGRMVRAQSLAM